MDDNQSTFNNTQEVLTSEDNNSDATHVDSDYELQKEIDKLDDALDNVAAEMQALRNKKEAIDKQVEKLNKEKLMQQTSLRFLKSSKVIAMLDCIVMTLLILGFSVLLVSVNDEKVNEKYNKDRAVMSSNYDAQIAALDTSLNTLIEQRNNLQNEIVRQENDLQKEIVRQEIASQKMNVESTVLAEENQNELDNYIASLSRYPYKQVEEKEYQGISCYEVVQKYDLGQYMLSNSGNVSVFPGAIIRGDSLMQGTTNYALISQDRTPMTLVCSNGGNSTHLEDISYGSVQKAVNELWSESNPEYAEKWDYTLRSVQSEEGLNLSLGIETGAGSLGINASQTQTTSTMAIVFTETYFSIVAEPLNSATQYFRYGSDLKNLGDYEPAYVSSVDYGRMVVVLVTTELSQQELDAKLSANISGVGISAGVGYIKKNIDSNCKIYCYGGDSVKSLQSIDSEELGGLKGWWNDLINGKADDIDGINHMISDDDSLKNPVPLSYCLNYLTDNSAVPAVAIISDNIIMGDKAKLVTITLEGNIAGTFRLSDAANAIGYVVNTDQIRITKKGISSGEIQFIWDSSNSASLTGFFNDTLVSYQLSTMPTETDNIYQLETKGDILPKHTDIHIYISDAIYNIQ